MILPYTLTKPYSKSRTHRFILKHLRKNDIPSSKIEIVTLSGKFEPVPKCYEIHDTILKYYILTSRARKQIEFVAKSLKKFIEKYAKDCIIIAYITNRLIEKLLKLSQKNFPVILIPKKPRRKILHRII